MTDGFFGITPQLQELADLRYAATLAGEADPITNWPPQGYDVSQAAYLTTRTPENPAEREAWVEDALRLMPQFHELFAATVQTIEAMGVHEAVDIPGPLGRHTVDSKLVASITESDGQVFPGIVLFARSEGEALMSGVPQQLHYRPSVVDMRNGEPIVTNDMWHGINYTDQHFGFEPDAVFEDYGTVLAMVQGAVGMPAWNANSENV